LLAFGQISMRKVDGWQTLNSRPVDQPIDLPRDQIFSASRRTRRANSNHIPDSTRREIGILNDDQLYSLKLIVGQYMGQHYQREERSFYGQAI